MTRILFVALSMIAFIGAGAAYASQDEPSRVSLRGRHLEWQKPAEESPHALTGERQKTDSEHEQELRNQGRMGYVRR